MLANRLRWKGVSLFVLGLTAYSADAADLSSRAHLRRLTGHKLPPAATAKATCLAHVNLPIEISVRLQMSREREFETLVQKLYDPTSPSSHKFLTSAEFAERFGASSRQLTQVENYLRRIGCVVDPGRRTHLWVDAKCDQQDLENAFRVKVTRWVSPEGDAIQSIDNDPLIPSNLPIEGIFGLTSITRHPNLIQAHGRGGGLSPSDIKTAYQLDGVTQDGTGETMALFELDGYKEADIDGYLSKFGISPGVPLQNVLIGGFDGSSGSGADEVTLDIELMMALAPKADKLLVYEAANTSVGSVAVYQKIADDNLAKVVSSSWGLVENKVAAIEIKTENLIFMQMALQGQSIYVAAGDRGAFEDGSNLSVQDPTSQPYVTSVGGTTLATQDDHTYKGEKTWWESSKKHGGGGGVSVAWPIPPWQVGTLGEGSGASTSRRNLPDVALNSDPATGYAIYFNGKWAVFGGTSCAAPLWAAFTALVNQKRHAGGLGPLGFANPAIAQVAQSASGADDFHDIADGSTNGQFPALKGYDLATGWGSFYGQNLIDDLSQSVTPIPSFVPVPTPVPGAPGSGGCVTTRAPIAPVDSANTALSMGLPLMVGSLVSYRKRRRSGAKGSFS